jgi:hypothetical protein
MTGAVVGKLAGFAAVLALAFGAAFGIGRAVGPIGDDRPAAPSVPVTEPTHDEGHP